MVAGADSFDDMDLLRHGGMSARRADTDDRLASVLAALDRDYMRGVVARMTASGSSPLGFRTAGTAEEHAVARYLAAELGGLGLRDVRLEPVPVDAWRFRADSLTVDGAAYECASFGGAPGTGGAGIDGEIVYVGRGSRADLAGLDLAGRIALIDWRGGEPARNLLWPSLSAAECARAGAVAAVITSLPGGRLLSGPRRTGVRRRLLSAADASPGHHSQGGRAAAHGASALRPGNWAAGRRRRGDPRATGYNVTGVLPGRRRGSPIVVAGHEDASFQGAIDDASGVEEYGIQDSAFDWCIGS